MALVDVDGTPRSPPSSSQPPQAAPAPTTTFEPGTGHLHLSAGPRARPSTLLASYPLKLLAPNPLPSQPPHVAIVYTLAYGGGLVAGDCVQLRVTIDPGCTLALLTQGSTKIYKQRAGLRPRSHGMSPALVRAIARGQAAPTVKQRMHVTIGRGGSLLLLPDSLSPFRGSKYAQVQRVELEEGAGVVILDWVNSGRGKTDGAISGGQVGKANATSQESANGQSKPGDHAHKAPGYGQSTGKMPIGIAGPSRESRDTEVWAMRSYSSTNEIVVGGEVVARERMVLDNPDFDQAGWSPTAMRLAPYHVYANLIVFGAPFQALRAYLSKIVDESSQFQLPMPPGLLWSYSPVTEDGGIVRVAGVEVEDVKVWIRAVLEHGGVADIVGPGIWPRCI